MSYIVYGALVGSIYGLWAISFSIIYRTTAIFHVMHAAAFTAAAYGLWRLHDVLGWLALPIALGIGIVVGLASELLLYRPLRKLGVPSILMFVVSLGGYIMVENFIQLLWRADTRMIAPPQVLESYVSVFGAGGSLLELFEAAVAIAAWLVTLALLRFTLTGKAVRAVAIAPDMAELAGIEVDRIRTVVFIYGSLLIAVAGVLMVMKTGIEPTSGLHVWVIAVIASLIGRGDITGSFLAGLGLGLAEAVILIWLPAAWQPIVPVSILAVYLTLMAVAKRLAIVRVRRVAQRSLRDASVPV
jgi:branched-subunit amino acid ABC-type transport system permease component